MAEAELKIECAVNIMIDIKKIRKGEGDKKVSAFTLSEYNLIYIWKTNLKY